MIPSWLKYAIDGLLLVCVTLLGALKVFDGDTTKELLMIVIIGRAALEVPKTGSGPGAGGAGLVATILGLSAALAHGGAQTAARLTQKTT